MPVPPPADEVGAAAVLVPPAPARRAAHRVHQADQFDHQPVQADHLQLWETLKMLYLADTTGFQLLKLLQSFL